MLASCRGSSHRHLSTCRGHPWHRDHNDDHDGHGHDQDDDHDDDDVEEVELFGLYVGEYRLAGIWDGKELDSLRCGHWLTPGLASCSFLNGILFFIAIIHWARFKLALVQYISDAMYSTSVTGMCSISKLEFFNSSICIIRVFDLPRHAQTFRACLGRCCCFLLSKLCI